MRDQMRQQGQGLTTRTNARGSESPSLARQAEDEKRFLSLQADTFAAANVKEKASACSVRMTGGGSCGNDQNTDGNWERGVLRDWLTPVGKGEFFLDYFFVGLDEFGFCFDAEAACVVGKLVHQLTQLCPAYPMPASTPRI
jgi:hypothetical protein